MSWLIGVWLLVSPANADQCAWVGQEVAKKAMPYLNPGTSFRDWCEPCKEQAPGPVQRVRSVEWVRPGGPGTLQLRLNGKDKDLAYLFVDHKGSFVNLAMKAGCETVFVSKKIKK